jgi:hypothetical protein
LAHGARDVDDRCQSEAADQLGQMTGSNAAVAAGGEYQDSGNPVS